MSARAVLRFLSQGACGLLVLVGAYGLWAIDIDLKKSGGPSSPGYDGPPTVAAALNVLLGLLGLTGLLRPRYVWGGVFLELLALALAHSLGLA